MIIQLVTSGADVDTGEPLERQTAGREIKNHRAIWPAPVATWALGLYLGRLNGRSGRGSGRRTRECGRGGSCWPVRPHSRCELA